MTQAKMTCAEVAETLHEALGRASGKHPNKNDRGFGYRAWAQHNKVHYYFGGPSASWRRDTRTQTITKAEALQYIDWLNAGNVGLHTDAPIEKSEPKRSGKTVWRVYKDWAGGWKLESQGVELSDKMMFFAERTQFTDHNTQKTLSDAEKIFSDNPREARKKAIVEKLQKIEALRQQIDQHARDIEIINSLRDPIEG